MTTWIIALIYASMLRGFMRELRWLGKFKVPFLSAARFDLTSRRFLFQFIHKNIFEPSRTKDILESKRLQWLFFNNSALLFSHSLGVNVFLALLVEPKKRDIIQHDAFCSSQHRLFSKKFLGIYFFCEWPTLHIKAMGPWVVESVVHS